MDFEKVMGNLKHNPACVWPFVFLIWSSIVTFCTVLLLIYEIYIKTKRSNHVNQMRKKWNVIDLRHSQFVEVDLFNVELLPKMEQELRKKM
jgi:hypothetical protein